LAAKFVTSGALSGGTDTGIVDEKSIEAGAQDWNFTCGVCHVGGGQMEYDRDMNPYSATSPSGDRYFYEFPHVQDGVLVPGRLVDVYASNIPAFNGAMSDDNKAEVDCLICHMASIKPMMKYYKGFMSDGVTPICSNSRPMGPNSDRNCDGSTADLTNGSGIIEDAAFGPAVDDFTPGTAYDMMNRNAAIKAKNYKNAASAGLGATLNTATGAIIAGTAPTSVSNSSILATPSSSACAVCHARNEDTIGVTSYGTALGMKAGYGNYWMLTEASEGYDSDNAATHKSTAQWFEFGCKTGMGKRDHRTGKGVNDTWGLSGFNWMFGLGKNLGDPIVNETLTATLMGMPFGSVTTSEKIPDSDVHDINPDTGAPTGMQCATCHYALGSKKSAPTAALVGSGEGRYETFPAVTSHGVAYPEEDVWAIDHQFAQADSHKDTYGKNNLDDTVSCESCHTTRTHPNLTDNGGSLASPTPAHTSFPALHLEKIHCTTCHIPEAYSAPARLKYRDWTVGYYKSQSFRNILDWNKDLVTDSAVPTPVMRGWGMVKEGGEEVAKIKPLLPSLMPIWNGTIGTTTAPVKNADVGVAIRALEDANGGGGAGWDPNGINVNHGNVYPLFDGFQLGDSWMIDTKTKVDALAPHIAAQGYANPFIKTFLAPFDLTHGVVPKEWALGGSKRGGCVSCHSSMDPYTRDAEGLPAGPNPDYNPNSIGFFEGYQQPLNNLFKGDPYSNPLAALPSAMNGIGKFDLAKNWVALFADFDCTAMCIPSGMGNDEPMRMPAGTPNASWNGAWDAFGNPVTTFATFDTTRQCEAMSTMEYFRGKGFFPGAPYSTLGMCTQFMAGAFDVIMGFPSGTAAMMGFNDGIAGLQGFVTDQGAPHDCDPFSGTVNMSPKNNAFGANFASVNACLPDYATTTWMDGGSPAQWTTMIQGTCEPDAGSMTGYSCNGGFKDGAMCMTVAVRTGMGLPDIGLSDDADCQGGNQSGMFINGRDTARNRNDIHIQQSVVDGVWRQVMPFGPSAVGLIQNPDNPAHITSWDQAKDSKCGKDQNEPCCKDPMTGMPAACADGMEVRTDIHANQYLGYPQGRLGKLTNPALVNCTTCHTQSLTTMNHPTSAGTPSDCTGCHMTLHQGTPLNVASVCGSCHTSGPGPNYTTTQLDALAVDMHDTAPIAKFTATPDSTTSFKVNFSAMNSTCPSGALSCTYAWDFGDGDTGSGIAVSHTYDDATPVTVTLTVATVASAVTSDSISQTVTPVAINAAPTGCADDFTTADLIVDQAAKTVTFTDGSSDADSAAVVYVNWGDGSPMETGAPSAVFGPHTYLWNGKYTIQKTVRDSAGLTCKANAVVVINPTQGTAVETYTVTISTSDYTKTYSGNYITTTEPEGKSKAACEDAGGTWGNETTAPYTCAMTAFQGDLTCYLKVGGLTKAKGTGTAGVCTVEKVLDGTYDVFVSPAYPGTVAAGPQASVVVLGADADATPDVPVYYNGILP
jgi:hypothetical protein